MEIAAGNYVAVFVKNQWIISGRTRFDQQHVLAMRECVANCAVHLRHTPQTVRVLDARVLLQM